MSVITVKATTLTCLSHGKVDANYWYNSRTAIINLDGKHLCELQREDLCSLLHVINSVVRRMPDDTVSMGDVKE